MSQQLPSHILEVFGTARQFKQAKRQDMKRLLAAIATYRTGCAYAPGYAKFKQAADILGEVAAALAVKRWGR